MEHQSRWHLLLTGRIWRSDLARVGGHFFLTGRIWRAPLSWRAHGDARRLEISARRFSTDVNRFLDLSKRPAQSAERQYLLLLLLAQDVHLVGGPQRSDNLLTSWSYCSDWLVFRCPRLAGFGCPPRSSARDTFRGTPARLVAYRVGRWTLPLLSTEAMILLTWRAGPRRLRTQITMSATSMRCYSIRVIHACQRG